MSRARRTLPLLLTVLTFASTLAFGTAIQTAGARPAHASATMIDALTSGACTEEAECWNPCTMGVDGTYPEADPRHYLPGPCGVSTPLPHGARFRVEMTPVTDAGPECAPGEVSAGVRVLAVAADGVTVAETGARRCVPVAADPLADGFGGALPTLYRLTAVQLDH